MNNSKLLEFANKTIFGIGNLGISLDYNLSSKFTIMDWQTQHLDSRILIDSTYR